MEPNIGHANSKASKTMSEQMRKTTITNIKLINMRHKVNTMKTSTTWSFKLPITLVVIFMALLNFSNLSYAEVERTIDQKLAAEPEGSVEIEHVNGSATITGWDKNEVSVEGELGERTEDFIFERSGSTIQIIVETEKSSGWGNWGGNSGDELTIFVPSGSKVSYTSVNADVRMTKVFGGASIDVVNGDIRVSELSGKIRLESVNGDIDAEKLIGDLQIETVNGDINASHTTPTPKSDDLALSTVNGDIDVQSSSNEVSVETVNGAIDLELVSVSDLEVNTVNGAIDIAMNLVAGGSVDVSSVGGRIGLSFQKDVGARFDIEAHAGGSIKNNITDEKQTKAKYGPRRWLEFSTENPESSVDISTVHGNVKLDTK
jgi:DUF4097 and DUF4098 domain-containing protein YvlB